MGIYRKKGRLSGERHPRARLSNEQVRNMRDARARLGWTYRQCAEFWSCSIWTARDILDYRTRASA